MEKYPEVGNVDCSDGDEVTELDSTQQIVSGEDLLASLSPEEKKKLKNKQKKKAKKLKEKEEIEKLEKLIEQENEGKDQYEIEVNWCIKQLMLGLTNPGVTKEQSKLASHSFREYFSNKKT